MLLHFLFSSPSKSLSISDFLRCTESAMEISSPSCGVEEECKDFAEACYLQLQLHALQTSTFWCKTLQ